MGPFLPLIMAFTSAALVGYAVIPFVYTKGVLYSQKRSMQLSNRLERVMPRQRIVKLTQLYMVAPVVMAGVCFLIFPEELRLFGLVLGVVAGLIFPSVYTAVLTSRNRKKFDNQLVDALMIMTSSFRGGLSLVQAMEAVVEEMPDPINLEFSTVLGENKMGVSLEEALTHLYNRMPSPAVQQMNTAILLARETGGNLPAIFQRIVGVIRERKRIQGQIETLTIQGKIQGAVMSLLPVAFFAIVYSTNPHYFDPLFTTGVGRAALITACVLQTVGVFLIWRISSFKGF